MEQSRTVQTQGGIGFLGFLAILFIGLKLTGYITWSWWWVLAPLWVPLAAVFTLAGLVFGFYLMVLLYQEYQGRRKKKG